MLDKLWRRLLWRSVMRDADRLIAAHGRGAYGMARLGATAAREADGSGHWSSVAHEVARRLERDRRAECRRALRHVPTRQPSSDIE